MGHCEAMGGTRRVLAIGATGPQLEEARDPVWIYNDSERPSVVRTKGLFSPETKCNGVERVSTTKGLSSGWLGTTK